MKLLFETENAEFTIDEHLNEEITRLQLATEEAVQTIYKRQDALMAQLKEHKQKCFENYANMTSLKQKNKQLINEMDAFIHQQRGYMNQLQIDDNQLANANQCLLRLQEEVEKEHINHKKAIFNNRMPKFVSDEQPLIDELLGFLTFESVDSSQLVN